MANHKKRRWDMLTDAEKHAAWVGMTARNRAVAVEAMSDRDRRMIDAADAMAAVRARGAVPEGCSSAIIAAPARGPLIPVQHYALHVDAKGEGHRIEQPYPGGCPARVGDAFDRMEDQARRAGGGALFEAVQVQAGRDYAALVERCESSGLSSTSLEVQSGKGGGGSVSEAVAHDMAQWRLMRARIGAGLALEVRRVRPSARGKRVAIRHIDLVDRVCVGGLTIGEVLKRCGWGVHGDATAALRGELSLCLDRMRGAAPRYGRGHKMQEGG